MAVKDFIINLDGGRPVLSKVVKLVGLVLVIPATNATSECSFSVLKRVKTYFRSSMKQQCLNDFMILHVHRELTDDLDLVGCTNDFVSANDRRLKHWGSLNK